MEPLWGLGVLPQSTPYRIQQLFPDVLIPVYYSHTTFSVVSLHSAAARSLVVLAWLVHETDVQFVARIGYSIPVLSIML